MKRADCFAKTFLDATSPARCPKRRQRHIPSASREPGRTNGPSIRIHEAFPDCEPHEKEGMPHSPPFARLARESTPLSPEGMAHPQAFASHSLLVAWLEGRERLVPRRERDLQRASRDATRRECLVPSPSRGSQGRERLIPQREWERNGLRATRKGGNAPFPPLCEARKRGNVPFPGGNETFVRLREARKGETQAPTKGEHLSSAFGGRIGPLDFIW